MSELSSTDGGREARILLPLWLSGATAAFVAAGVFYVDTFTKTHGALSVLYLLVLLLCADILRGERLYVLVLGTAVLSAFSYVYQHGLTANFPAIVRLAVAYAALGITFSLLLNIARSRSDLLASYQALSNSEKRYRTIFDESRVALWERDYSSVRQRLLQLKADGITDLTEYLRVYSTAIDEYTSLIKPVAANRAALELIGTTSAASMRSHILPDDEAFAGVLEAIFEERPHFEGTGFVTSNSGASKMVLITMSLPSDPSAFNRVVVGMIDVTQREQTQKALIEAQSELAKASRAATVGALSASLAHELNQPLAANVVNARTLLRWIEKAPPDMDSARRSVARIIRDSERASEIIQNTRSMLSQESAKLEVVHLSELIEETRALLEHDIAREEVEFHVSPCSVPCVVKAVRIELQQVLINLVTNAIQAMVDAKAPERKLELAYEQVSRTFVCLTVTDSGPGMNEAVMQKLFTPFHTTKPLGLGMGLSISRSTMESRGGSLTARNHPMGGAIFEMTIPIS